MVGGNFDHFHVSSVGKYEKEPKYGVISADIFFAPLMLPMDFAIFGEISVHHPQKMYECT